MTPEELDKAIAEAEAKSRALLDQVNALAPERVRLKQLRWPTKCCRCWPYAVTKTGQCRCCDCDHVAGHRPPSVDPDYFPEDCDG